MADQEATLLRLADPVPRFGWKTVVTTVVIVLAMGWSASGAEFSLDRLVTGVPDLLGFLARMWPPDFTKFWQIVPLLIETIQIALIGTVLGTLASLLISFLAASNISPRWLALSARGVLNVLRSIPELIYALMFVAAVGLGPFAGTLALAIGAVGFMGRIFADTLETVATGPIEAMEAVGARRPQVIVHAILPQAMPLLTSYTLLLWESNIRGASVLGIVGAGGIGLELTVAMRMFDYGHLAMMLICIIVMVTLMDRLSAWLRRQLL